MRKLSIAVAITLAIHSAAVLAQEHRPVAAVPRLVRIANTFHPANGLQASPVESVTLSIYRAEHDVDALWSETQNVDVDAEGHYVVVMGSTLPDGVPADLFVAAEPRWLGVLFNRPGEPDPPRVLLVSVPYALKAADAETLGGRPSSDYLLSPAAVNGTPSTAPTPPVDTPVFAAAITKPAPKVTSGTSGYIARFANSTDLGNSVMYQNGGYIGLGTANPGGLFHISASPDSVGLLSGQRSADSAEERNGRGAEPADALYG